MKKMLLGTSSALLLVPIAACGSGDEAGSEGSESWEPSEPVTVIVPYDAGGGTDLVFRQLAQIINDQELSPERWVVENRDGGSGTTGMRYVSDQGDDAHTLLATTPGHISVPMQQSMDLSVSEDLTAVANTLIDPQVLYTTEGSEYQSVESLIGALESAPESVAMGGGAVAQDDHLTTLLFQRETQTQVNYIPFDGGGDLKTAMIGGQVDVGWMNPSEAAGQTVEEGGNLVPIAVALEDRLDGLPDVPTFAEEGYDVVYEMFFRALTGPPEMPEDAVAYHADVVEQAVNSEEWQQFLQESMVEPRYLGGEEFAETLEGWSAEIESLLSENQ